MRAFILFIFGVLIHLTAFNQEKRILIENATVHVGNGQVFEKGLVGIAIFPVNETQFRQ